ncbi:MULTISPECIES: low-specificity L-threonine aldolase [Variovorax]|jgi:threonine aldolase|uniref:low-specificity L-threonine aldolase n=1 Tax=Variovorax TaxID=34072 RepID=UPI00086FA314|nr:MULTISPECIES: low-specificity L-threonine aldolase [Variovorax]MBN8755522.1 low-specificity L-threonine aldolase [Variovorax sp.]ODU14147.1 MAG: threonine aldolase [Variovorax sp. SCN 67-85]ODV19926.1 MAG: threonine aldolase [Variovorax sp. SCN 67-20]OJZ12624.1 MAG: threonine aldolase [Variovorax sp. 67-131]UKI09371.1 low-specificity L-threonine aldolase [Variovorax paradoxus]
MTDRTHLVDLRSDTVTQPTLAMREAMMAAPLGDDVFGTDPSVNALQEKIAAMLGFEAALFVPTGTQSNLCAILSHCGRGDEYIVGQQAHCYRWEGGGAAVFGSVQPQPLDHAADGTLPLAQIEAAIKPDDAHFARTRLLALENTLGGKLLPFEYVQAATDLAKRKGLQRHLDGARLFNAATAQAASSKNSDIRAEARRIAQCFDSVSVCFSKGLGAPIGSALVGSREFIARAHRIRKMAGGGMRQAGLLAAAASHALDHHIDRLADDHALAQRLAQGLEGIEGLKVEAPHTNIVFVDLTGAAQARSTELLASLNQQGILATGLYRLRFVTHLDVDAAGVDRAVTAIRGFFNA